MVALDDFRSRSKLASELTLYLLASVWTTDTARMTNRTRTCQAASYSARL
jgi:hypothetical protein